MPEKPQELTPALLLSAYAQGLFPMSDDADDPEIFWVRPEMRGIIPLDKFHISRSLAKKVRQNPFDIRYDTDFNAVIAGCAEAKQGRETTWINQTIRNIYGELFNLGYCHTVEAWEGHRLVGGLYGISLGRAFFGESMFSRENDASKLCLVSLVAHLKTQGFTLLDTQFITSHLAHFGAIEILQKDYEKLLSKALMSDAVF